MALVPEHRRWEGILGLLRGTKGKLGNIKSDVPSEVPCTAVLVLGEVPSKCNQFRLDLCGVQAMNLCLSVHLPPCAGMPSRSRRKLRRVRWLSLWLAITEFLLALEITSCVYSVRRIVGRCLSGKLS